jgi:hypothetical protein
MMTTTATMTRATMPRDREYDDNAARQKAYRERKRIEEELIREQLRQARGEAAERPPRAGRRITEGELRTLARVLAIAMHPTAEPNERDTAIRLANNTLRRLDLSWYDVLGVSERPRR